MYDKNQDEPQEINEFISPAQQKKIEELFVYEMFEQGIREAKREAAAGRRTCGEEGNGYRLDAFTVLLHIKSFMESMLNGTATLKRKSLIFEFRSGEKFHVSVKEIQAAVNGKNE